jgi:acetolactate synthase-1/2/3 large subunit
VPGASKIIHLDIDPVAIGRNYRPDVALMGDAKVTLRDLLANLRTMVANPKPKAERIEELTRKIKAYETSVTREGTDQLDSDAVPIMPQRVVNEVSKFIGPRDIVVTDTGNMLSHTSLFLKLKGTGKVYLPCGGTLGSSLAMAIGASFGAAKDQRIIHMTGDGGMGYNLCDIETSVRYKDQHVPMVTVVHNNSCLASPIRPFTQVSYAKIFEDFGGCGIRAERPEDIRGALARALESGKPACVDCITEPTAHSRMGGS